MSSSSKRSYFFPLGGAAGLALAYAALRWFVPRRSDMVRAEWIGIDAVVVATVAGLILICALLAALIPVLASRSENGQGNCMRQCAPAINTPE